VTLAHYEQYVEEFRAGTRDHDVSQNIAWLLITAAEPQQLSRFSTVSTPRCFTEKKPITLDIA
jgi:hypothetical protein